MSRPGPRPPAPDHRQHDTLLVAQHVAGDPLGAQQQLEAGALLARCPDCAALAADLRVLSVAVAQEPVPPRRRDFRIGPEQAEHLRGNVLSRFLGRLRLPQTRAFAPAAAGMLSVGLIFVVAGYAWPDGGSVGLDASEGTVPTAVEEVASLAPSPPSLERAEPEAAVAPLLEEPEGLAEHQAGTSARSSASKALGSSADDAAFADEIRGVDAPDAEAGRLTESAAVAADSVGEQAAEAAPADALEPEAVNAGAADPEAAAGLDRYSQDSAVEDLDGGLAEAAATASLSDTHDDLEALLIVVGAGLALGGGLLLLLAWLVRREADPLLR